MSISTFTQASDTDRNLLFGLVGVQADLFTASQFQEAWDAWCRRDRGTLADVLEELRILDGQGRWEIERLVRRKLARHNADTRTALSELTGDTLRRALLTAK